MAASTTEGRVARALLARLHALVLAPALPIADPDVSFTKPASGMWLEAALFDVPTETLTLPAGGTNRLTGLFQITVVAPLNGGIVKPREVAGQIINHFKRGTRMFDGGQQVEVVLAPYVSATIKDEPWTRTPVTIRYLAFASQPA